MTKYRIPIVYPQNRGLEITASSIEEAKHKAGEYEYYADHWQTIGELDWDNVEIVSEAPVVDPNIRYIVMGMVAYEGIELLGVADTISEAKKLCCTTDAYWDDCTISEFNIVTNEVKPILHGYRVERRFNENASWEVIA